MKNVVLECSLWYTYLYNGKNGGNTKMKVGFCVAKWARKAVKVSAILVAIGLISSWNMPVLDSFAEKNYDRPDISHDSQLNHITFNSMTDTPFAEVCGGTEKNFVTARMETPTEGAWECNEIRNVGNGDVYEVSVLVHNNVNTDWNKEQGNPWEWTIAKDVTVNITIPRGNSTSHTITGTIRASNADPDEYKDDITFASSNDFSLEFVPGSAHYVNGKGDFAISNDVVGNNVFVGYESMNGEMPGCRTYSGKLYFLVKVKMEDNPSVKKEVRIKGSNDWKDSVKAEVGDEVEFRITYKNAGKIKAESVTMKDVLPAGLEYVENTARMYSGGTSEVGPAEVAINFNELVGGGVKIGSFEPGETAYVQFTAKVVGEKLDCGKNKVKNSATIVSGDKTVKDDASVEVERSCDNPSCYDAGNGIYYDKQGNTVSKEDYIAQCKEPEPDCLSNPDLPECKTIPNTGPAEIISAIIILLGIGGAGFYFYRTGRAAKKIKDVASGKKTDKASKETKDSKENVAKEADDANKSTSTTDAEKAASPEEKEKK